MVLMYKVNQMLGYLQLIVMSMHMNSSIIVLGLHHTQKRQVLVNNK